MAYKRKRRLTKKQKQRRKAVVSAGIIVLLAFTFGLFMGRHQDSGSTLSDHFDTVRNETALFFGNLFGAFDDNEPERSSEQVQETAVRFLDVGQGSATLLQAEDGTTILIDTGRYEDKEQMILQYLDQYIGMGGKIDLLIFTHNDSDHIGYGDLILQYYDVKEVWMNGQDATSQIYERILDALSESPADYAEPKRGEMHTKGPFSLEVLHPVNGENSDQNDSSIVLRVTSANFSGIFSGDASERIETDIIDSGQSVESAVLQMGHHGAAESTSSEWINAVQPDFAVYSASDTNPYGHPDDRTLERLNQANIPFYGTAEYGTISVFVDEAGNYTIELEKGDEADESGS